MRRLSLLIAVFLLSAVAAHADLSGAWTGTYTVTTACNNGSGFTNQGSASMILSQSGTSVSGTLTVNNFNLPDKTTCTGTPVGTASFSVSGSYDGTNLTMQMNVNGQMVPLQGPANDTTIALNLAATDTSGSFTFVKSSGSGTTDVSGTWSGSYQSVSACSNNNPQMSSGNATIVISQNGSALSGTITYVLSLQHCVQVSPVNVTDNFTGTVYGAAFSMTFQDPNLGASAGGGVVANGIMTVAFSGGDTSVVATLTKGGAGSGPTIGSFTATPASVSAGQSSTLQWSTSNATSVVIDNGIGSVPVSGSTTVTPASTTTYTLTASNSSGSSTASVTVTVNPASPANVVVAQFPIGMLQVIGQGGATDHFTLLNAGGSDTDVTLSSHDNFYTVSPASFHLAAGASRVITLTGIAQKTAATYDGAITTGSLAIPVHLLVAAPPQGTVVPQLSGPTRAETVALIGQNQGSGSVSFTNSGTATLYGLAVSDVPWMTPQSGLIIIPPGQTVSISYTIDRTKRADGTAPLGGAKCTLTLRFLTGTGAGKWAAPFDSSTTTSGVSVSLVDVVKPGVAPGTPPPLGNGEVAFFVPGISSKAAAVGDLLLANRGTSSVNDLKMFFGASGGSATQVSSISSIASNAGVTFPGIVRNVFGASDQTGSLQLRSSQIANVSIGTVQSNTVSTSTSYQTALPVLRSDRGARSGDAIYLSGVYKSTLLTTNLELQEMSGNAVTVTTDFLDASGNVIASRSDALAPFAFKEVGDAVPVGAVAARVKNPAGGSAVVGAYALLFDNATTDPVVVTDLLTNANASTLIAPLFPPTNASVQQFVSFTNVTATPISVTATPFVAAGHHRAAPHAADAAPRSAPTGTFTLAPFASWTYAASGPGYVKLDAPAGSLRGSATYAIPISPGNLDAFGSGVPVLANALALANGAAKRFAGIEAASATTVAQGTPGTSRTNLTLVETAGQTATVRVTLRFSFIASSLTSASTTASKDFDVPANGSITVVDLASAVLGIERNSLGDLRGMQVDVSVVNGSGKVLPLVESIDNASGDVTVRND